MPDNLLGGRYVITELLGEGGIGVVYKAEDLQENCEVAIKFMIQEAAVEIKTQQIRQRYFAREIAILSKIRHPGIVSLYDSGFTEIGLPYFVMEYIVGKTLLDILKDGPLLLGRAFNLLQQIGSALDCIHQHNAIHRDLKPENIMIVTKNGKEIAKLLDFGIAKILEDAQSGSPFMPITQAGHILGTVDYLSPEQWQDKPLDSRADIYAFGLIAYEMLTGYHPFRGGFSIGDTMMRHLEEEPLPPSSFDPEIPLLLDQVILRSLAKDRNHRYSSAIEFLTDFEEVLAEIYRRSVSYLSNPATETLMYEIVEIPDEEERD
ncbi:MAG: serine/threonine protein kinase bacterial [bacterium]|nr:MAG: serine/threonine protein kinase bacterial [bacterium]